MRSRLALSIPLFLATLVIPGTAWAQVASKDDPCYRKMNEQGLSAILTTTQWSGPTYSLGRSLLEIKYFAEGALLFVEINQSEDPDMPLEQRLTIRRQLKELKDCLPWLVALATRLDEELAKRGVSMIELDPEDPRDRKARAKALERERLEKEAAAAFEKLRVALRSIAK